ncbi:MAG TPA: TonB family protein [Candidatus Angelobacter sp.]|nr:TonB family protein [Candidatus Angelobacter sp.]
MTRPEMFEEREAWTGPLALSVGFHLFLAVVIISIGYLGITSGSNWGGSNAGGSTGETVNATLVSNAGIPLPHQEQTTENIVATENKGVAQSVPQPVVEDKTAIPIPDKIIKNTRPKIDRPPTPPVQNHPQPPVTPSNVVPYGEGGPVSGPFGAFSAAHTKGGFSFQSGGDFGSKFAWYVQGVRDKVANNWYTVEVGASAVGHRAYILFDINDDGSPTNVRLEQTSGVPALDQSAIRAIQRIDGFGPTPTHGKVSVEFWFDYQR